MNRSWTIGAAVLAAVAVVGVRTGWSQDQAGPQSKTPVGVSAGYSSSTANDSSVEAITVIKPERFAVARYVGQSAIKRLVHELSETTDDKKKAELVKQLETAIAESFDEDLKDREGEISKLEERLTKLRTLLERRRKAKSDIVQLEVKVLTNEADGLGFSGLSPRSRGKVPMDNLREMMEKGQFKRMDKGRIRNEDERR